MERREFEDALKAFKRASELGRKRSSEAHLGMARAHHGLGAFRSAVKSCKDAAKHSIEDRKLEWPSTTILAAASKLFRIQPIPTYVLLGHEGIVRGTRAGWSPATAAWLDSEVRKYLRAMKGDGQR